MKNNTWTIMCKELTRFLKDKALFFTVILLPGLSIYLTYSIIGNRIAAEYTAETSGSTTLYVDNLPPSLQPLLQTFPTTVVTEDFSPEQVLTLLQDKDNGVAYAIFPPHFDQAVAAYDPADGTPAPNIQIFYNSSSPQSLSLYTTLQSMLNGYEAQLCNRFDINANTSGSPSDLYDQGQEEDQATATNIFGNILPMLIMIMLFSACMSVAPTSIAGEKERGTIATLLITPLKRTELAWGKILGLSLISLMGGLSSFAGIILGLQQMLKYETTELPGTLYAATDYVALLLVILSTVLVIIGVISIISTYANSVKAAQTTVAPLMILVMVVGLTTMMDTTADVWTFAIPLYNSTQCLALILSKHYTLWPIVITLVSNLAYTSLSVVVLNKMFNSEHVMFRQ